MQASFYYFHLPSFPRFKPSFPQFNPVLHTGLVKTKITRVMANPGYCWVKLLMIILQIVYQTISITRQRCWTISSRGSVELIASSSKFISST